MTAELISREAVLTQLSRHIGATNGISCADLAVAVAGMFTTKGTERQIRSTIETLRKEGYHICGSPSTGYFMASSDEELFGTCEFLYARAMTSLAQIAAMRRVSLPDLRGQLRLPT